LSATATSPAYDSSATEADLVQCILAKPAARAGFVALAEFLETQGNVGDACFDQLQTKTPTNYCGILNHATLVFDGNNRLVIDRHGVRNFLLNRKDASYQLHTLRLLGIDESRIVWIDTLPATFECERLALCRLTNSMGMAYRAGNIDWLRNQPWVGKSSATSVTAPAAKHKLAIRRDVRGFTQNDVIYESLAQRGYRVVYPEHYAYEEQVSLFRHASHIVAPHGAALSLLTYAAPDTEVHEFYGAHVHPCFYAISAMLGQRYYNYNCAPSPVTEASDNPAGNTATGNKGLSERLRQSIDLDPAMLETINLYVRAISGFGISPDRSHPKHCWIFGF